MYRRINITLPKETIELIDRTLEKGERSQFIDQAIRFYMRYFGQRRLRKLLKEGAIKRSKRDLELTQEWFSMEQESWQARRNR